MKIGDYQVTAETNNIIVSEKMVNKKTGVGGRDNEKVL
jgi:hypothetical protein